jgi:hypothetical protein
LRRERGEGGAVLAVSSVGVDAGVEAAAFGGGGAMAPAALATASPTPATIARKKRRRLGSSSGLADMDTSAGQYADRRAPCHDALGATGATDATIFFSTPGPLAR